MIFIAIWPFVYACKKGVKISDAMDSPHPGVFDMDGTIWDNFNDYLLHND